MCPQLLFALIIGVSSAASATENFTFEGFSIGMPRSVATELRPTAPWKEVMRGTPNRTIRKEFKAKHLGREAEVSIDLGANGEAVRAIGFTFATQTDEQCISQAVEALSQLEKLYGVETETSLNQPGKQAKWVSKGGFIVRWFELCASGAQRYVVTYANGG